MNEPTPELAKALATVQANLPKIEKTKRADVETQKGRNYSYTYADLAGVSDAILPLLGKNGLAFTARPTRAEGGGLILAYQLMHESGETLEGEFPLKGDGTPQAIGSAITYARRYCLCAITGVAPEDDDDGAAAEAEAATKKGTAQRAAPRPTKPHQAQETAPPKGPTAQRKQAPASPPLPSDGDSNQITGPQLARLAIMFNNVGWTERDDKLRAASIVVGRQLGSSKELTKAEASGLMDMLEECAGQDDPAQALTDKLDMIQAAEPVGGEIVAEIVEE